MHKLVHAWGLSQFSFGALQLLGKIIPIYRSNTVVKLRLRSHFVVSFTMTRAVTDLVIRYRLGVGNDLH
jgi:hypothetical protein